MQGSLWHGAPAALRMVLLLVLLLSGSPAFASHHPNIVFIVADDMDYAALQSMSATRSVIGDAGMTFTRNYVEVPLCAPSRATFLTGLYAHNHKVLTVDNSNGGFRQFRGRGHEQRTVAVALRDAGYATGLVGKYLNGFPDKQPETYIPPGWTYWAVAVQRGDVPYRQFNYKLNENGKLVTYRSSANDYGTDVYARKSVEFIESAVKADKSFFLFLSVFAPHDPAASAPRHAKLFPDAGVPRTPSFAEADISDKPSFLRNPSLDTATIAALDAHYARRLRALQAVDEAVRKIYDTLKRLGRVGNTYIVFTSDNGFHLGQHRLQPGKQLAYEEDIRQPLLIRGPGIPAGRTSEHLVGNVDFAPTFVAWAGVTIPGSVDGRSLAPLLGSKPPSTWRQSFPLARWRIPNAANDPWPEFKGTRTTRYTWVEWANGTRELYDNVADPHQLQNLAGKSGYSTLRSQLTKLTVDLAACRGAACRTVENRKAPVRN